MPDFLLELLSEEIPARMQAKAEADLARLFAEQLAAAGLQAAAIETYATPRRLALIARNLPAETEGVREEIKGPRASAPPQALEGFLRKTGLTREELVDRDGIFFAIVEKPGRATAALLAEAIPAIVRAFPWPKSMRWGASSASTESQRWVRPLQGIVALLGEDIIDFEVAGVRSGAATVGHRFHHPGIITIGSANDYAEKLRACHVIIDPGERRRIIADGAAAAARGAGLSLVDDEGLLAENAGLTEWPVPLLGRFDPAFLDVPPEVIQLTMRTNQKYFACTKSSPAFAGEGDQPEAGGGARSEAEGQTSPDGLGPSTALRAVPLPEHARGGLAPNFICTANIEASDGGAAIVAGNERVLSARLSDAKFFWEQDLHVPLEEQAAKLGGIVFHEKLGTIADKVERVAKLARWLVEEGIVKPPLPLAGEGRGEGQPGEAAPTPERVSPTAPSPNPLPRAGEGLAARAETAARLCKADLVTGMVGEFPELQGLIGGYLARAQGHPPEVADAIRDHYKPVGQGDEVPTAPVTVAVSLADKLDSLITFFVIGEKPTGSKDPFALRRSALGILSILTEQRLRLCLGELLESFLENLGWEQRIIFGTHGNLVLNQQRAEQHVRQAAEEVEGTSSAEWVQPEEVTVKVTVPDLSDIRARLDVASTIYAALETFERQEVIDFFADRLKVQQREAGVRHDLIDAVFALGGEDDLVRLLARVKALQAFVETPEGADLLAGYKRAANILKKEGWDKTSPPRGGEDEAPLRLVRGTSQAPHGEGERASSERPESKAHLQTQNPLTQPSPPRGEGLSDSYTPEAEEAALIAALDVAEPRARAAIGAEDFEGAMSVLASLRAPVDHFFDKVTVNDADPAKRSARLDLLARLRDAVHAVADFSKIEG